MVLKTLEFMEKGGIHDHVGQVKLLGIVNDYIVNCSTIFPCSQSISPGHTDGPWIQE